jgi:hypothetical protein
MGNKEGNFLKNIAGDMVYQPKIFLKNLPKYENLGRNGIRRQFQNAGLNKNAPNRRFFCGKKNS